MHLQKKPMHSKWKMLNLKHHLQSTYHIKPAPPTMKKNVKYEPPSRISNTGLINNHTKSFNLEHYENNMELSKEYCLKNKVTWRIIRKCATFNTNKRKCYVFQQKAWNCFIQRRQFTEQFFIIFSWDATIFRLKIAVRLETLSLKTQYFHFSNI